MFAMTIWGVFGLLFLVGAFVCIFGLFAYIGYEVMKSEGILAFCGYVTGTVCLIAGTIGLPFWGPLAHNALGGDSSSSAVKIIAFVWTLSLVVGATFTTLSLDGTVREWQNKRKNAKKCSCRACYRMNY